mmetsp:Transcript_28452/g.53321  ORF Transcript_28452/g.53321 Transcript_28452/m.53321 type:complete len:272 (-) Transcript_28452:858-1673(-)
MERLFLSRSHHDTVTVVHVHELVFLQHLMVQGQWVWEARKRLPCRLLNVSKDSDLVADADRLDVLELVSVVGTEDHELLITRVQEAEEGEHVARVVDVALSRGVLGVVCRNLVLPHAAAVEVLQLHLEVWVIFWQVGEDDRVVVVEVVVDCKPVVDEIASLALASIAIEDLLAPCDTSVCDHGESVKLVVELPVGLLIRHVVEHISIGDQGIGFRAMDVEPEVTGNDDETAPHELEVVELAEFRALPADARVLRLEVQQAVLGHLDGVGTL